ncbi:hypothetical protein KYX90_12960, partial [Enterococcus lactis]|uniref:hypothetical protein n=1 Tax=Enterococcus lactis TaxID=357441 RepID=UPI001C7D5657
VTAAQDELDIGNDPADFAQKNLKTFGLNIHYLQLSYDRIRDNTPTDTENYKWKQRTFKKLSNKEQV